MRDFGAGIPVADLDRVLEPFVRNLMHQQHGEVVLANVKDERGAGLEAKLIIPLAR